MRKVHTFDNGLKVYSDHLLDVQLKRYAVRNVHEQEEEDIFIKLISKIPPNSTYVNVGSAIGYYALLAKRLRPDIKIYCYEPLPEHIDYFVENINLNAFSLSDFRIINKAISNVKGQVNFKVSSYSSSLFKPNQKVEEFENISVESDTLSSIFNYLNISDIALLQMDIQGFERHVLKEYFNQANSHGSIDQFLVGTHGHITHSICKDLFSDNSYQILIDEPDTKHQPDGILLAKKISEK